MTQSAPTTSAAPGIFGYTFILSAFFASRDPVLAVVALSLAPRSRPSDRKIVDNGLFRPDSSKLWLAPTISAVTSVPHHLRRALHTSASRSPAF